MSIQALREAGQAALDAWDEFADLDDPQLAINALAPHIERLWEALAPGPTGDILVQVVEGREVVESKPLPPDEYIVLCGERRYVDGIQSYPVKGTVVVTIKRLSASAEGAQDA